MCEIEITLRVNMLLDQQIAPFIFWNKHLKIQLLSNGNTLTAHKGKTNKQKKYKSSVNTTLFVINHQRHVSAIKSTFRMNTKSCRIHIYIYIYIYIDVEVPDGEKLGTSKKRGKAMANYP